MIMTDFSYWISYKAQQNSRFYFFLATFFLHDCTWLQCNENRLCQLTQNKKLMTTVPFKMPYNNWLHCKLHYNQSPYIKKTIFRSSLYNVHRLSFNSGVCNLSCFITKASSSDMIFSCRFCRKKELIICL